jgi:hypothetical protein
LLSLRPRPEQHCSAAIAVLTDRTTAITTITAVAAATGKESTKCILPWEEQKHLKLFFSF